MLSRSQSAGMELVILLLSLLHIRLIQPLDRAGKLSCTYSPFVLAPERLLINGTHHIGFISSFMSLQPESGLCNGSLNEKGVESFEATELLAHLIDEINGNGSILPPGMKLGLRVYDDFHSSTFTAGQLAEVLNHCNDDSQLIAVICCSTSHFATLTLPTLTSRRIPQLSNLPILSASASAIGTAGAEYLLQLAPSIGTRVKAITDILLYFNWTYVAVLYDNSDYGIKLFHDFRSATRRSRICTGYSALITETSLADSARIIDSKSANIIILLAPFATPHKLLADAFRSSPRRYTWIKVSNWNHPAFTSEETELFRDAINIGINKPPPGDIVAFLGDPDRWTLIRERNPWATSYWEQCRCRWFPAADCSDTITTLSHCGGSYYLRTTHDSLWTIAFALRSYAAAGHPTRRFDTSTFLRFLLNVSFTGAGGNVEFVRGEVPNTYTFEQLTVDGADGAVGGVRVVTVGEWRGRNATVWVNHTAMTWAHGDAPVSTCNSACAPGERKVTEESACCFKCAPCYAVERLLAGECVACPKLSWPTGNSCAILPPRVMEVRSVVGVTVVGVSVLGVVLTVVTAALFVVHREHQLIKATCRETSLVALVGVALQFASPLTFIFEPTGVSCAARRVMFHLPFAVIYAAVVVKCVKIHRIFRLGRRSAQIPQFVGWRAQLITISGILAAQVLLLVVSLFHFKAGWTDTMPNRLEPIVERVCIESAASVGLCFGLNVLLLLISASLGLKTRKLPDNFNESQQIAFCLCTVLLLCGVLIPVSFVVGKSEMHDVCLFICQTGSALVVLSLSFLPKLYAVYYKTDDDKEPHPAVTKFVFRH